MHASDSEMNWMVQEKEVNWRLVFDRGGSIRESNFKLPNQISQPKQANSNEKSDNSLK
jgi:hypothetical protein